MCLPPNVCTPPLYRPAVRGAVTVVAVAFVALACDRPAVPSGAQSPDVPPYLRSAFHSLDSVLTVPQRDSLRALPLDSAFRFRNHRLREHVTALVATWVHSPIGDTVLAHGEQTIVTGEIVLDLYQQHLQRQPLDFAGALRRISPEYVDNILPHRVSVDSVFLRKDLDGTKIADELVREERRRIEIDAQGRDSIDDIVAEYRLALYLDAPPLTRPPAWSAAFDDINDGQLVQDIPLASGGTLLVIGVSGADASESVILLVRQGTLREVLRHQIDYGEGSFGLRDAEGRVVVEVTGEVQLGERRLVSDIQCPQTAWAGSTLLYDESARGFVVQRAMCVPRQ